MLNCLFCFALIITVYDFIKESLEKPVPKNQRFDWDSYNADIKNGISITEQNKKRKNGEYYTTEPLKQNYENVIDRKRYEYDIEIYGLEQAEASRKCGRYKYVSYFSGNES